MRKPKKIKPIKTQSEANQVFAYLVKTTSEHFGCTEAQAKLRVTALMDSKELEGLTPDNIMFQMIVDKYVSTPIVDLNVN